MLRDALGHHDLLRIIASAGGLRVDPSCAKKHAHAPANSSLSRRAVLVGNDSGCFQGLAAFA